MGNSSTNLGATTQPTSKFKKFKIPEEVRTPAVRTYPEEEVKPKKGIKAVPGLRMLIKQGADAAELFMDGGHPCVEDSHYLMMKRKLNVVLIGMPYAGKTMFGQLVSKKLKKEFIDVDVEI